MTQIKLIKTYCPVPHTQYHGICTHPSNTLLGLSVVVPDFLSWHSGSG